MGALSIATVGLREVGKLVVEERKKRRRPIGKEYTYVWFSPLGLANHATAQKTTMKMTLTRRLQLLACELAG